MNHLKYFIIILLFQFLFTGALCAEINSWVDEDGVRRYSDTRPDMPDGSFEVIEDVENTEPPKKYQHKVDYWQELIDQRRAEEEKRKNERLLEEQKTDWNEKLKSAYQTLNNLKDLVTGTVDWDEYESLLVEAKQKLDAIPDVTEIKDAERLMTEAYESYAVVPELKRLEMTGQRKGLIARIEKMNEAWGTEAPKNYYKARRICWQRAADMLDKSGINP